MHSYTILYAEDVPHYGFAHIEAATPGEAITAAKAYDYSDLCPEPDWKNPTCRRIVHIEAPDGTIIAADIPLDDWIAQHLPSAAGAARPSRYNHAFTIAFSVETSAKAGADVTPAEIRRVIYRRLSALDDGELLEAVGLPFDTYEITNPNQGENHD